MNRLALLRSAKTINDLADLLGVKHSGLSFILYKKPTETKYQSFTVPKKAGGVRAIHAPTSELKLFQRRLADLLQECLNEIEATFRKTSEDRRPEKISHGFHPGRSIITNAIQHRRRRYVLNVDLKDFFGTCNFGRVRGLLIKNEHFLLHDRVATVIAHLACHEGALPQGAPSSPVISNLIGRVLDIRLVKLANSVGCSYSRYADDLTFSTNDRQFPPQLAAEIPPSSGRWEPGPALLGEIASSGFSLNPKKTRMQLHESRQMVTGLVVNTRVNVSSDYRHLIRAMVHRLLTKGEYEISTAAGPIKGTTEQLQGMLSFIDSIDEFNRKRFKERDVPFPRQRDETFRDFVFYRHVYQASRPTLICEGKTDNVYLTHAIRAMAKLFPDLASPGFYPVSADTSKKAEDGHKECLCRSEGSTALSSSVVLWSR
ncbi:MAG: RNA-directed DNA polymerase, partial [Nevskiaceae bacterium]